MKSADSHAIHEVLHRPRHIRRSSDRTLALVLAAFFMVVALAPYIHGRAPRLWAVFVSAALVVVGVVAPRILEPVNTYWTRLGAVLQEIMNPVVMGLVFYSTIVPIGVIMRLLGHDTLQLRWDPGVSSYWIERKPHGSQPGSMKAQY